MSLEESLQKYIRVHKDILGFPVIVSFLRGLIADRTPQQKFSKVNEEIGSKI